MAPLHPKSVYDLPGAGGAAAWLKRRRILESIEVHAPEVLRDLKCTVMPKWTERAADLERWSDLAHDENGQPRRDLEVLALSEAIREWSERHHIPWSWARDAALRTVSWWSFESDNPEDGTPPRLVDELRWMAPALHRWFTPVRRLPPLDWDPTIETSEAFSDRVAEYKAAVCAAYEAGGYVPIKVERERDIAPADRLKFFVLRVIKRQTFKQISDEHADRGGNPTENAITQCVHALAQAAGVRLED